jgi:hypothetical protein
LLSCGEEEPIAVESSKKKSVSEQPVASRGGTAAEQISSRMTNPEAMATGRSEKSPWDEIGVRARPPGQSRTDALRKQTSNLVL